MGSGASKPSAVESVAKDVKANVNKAVDKTSEAASKASKQVKKAGKEVSKAIDDIVKPAKKEEKKDRLTTDEKVALSIPIVVLLGAVGYVVWRKLKGDKGNKGDDKPAAAAAKA